MRDNKRNLEQRIDRLSVSAKALLARAIGSGV